MLNRCNCVFYFDQSSAYAIVKNKNSIKVKVGSQMHIYQQKGGRTYSRIKKNDPNEIRNQELVMV